VKYVVWSHLREVLELSHNQPRNRGEPRKDRVIADMSKSGSIQDIRWLNDQVAAICRFLAKSVKKSVPFFKVLQGAIEELDKDTRKLNKWIDDCS